MKHTVQILQNEETAACFVYPDKAQAMAKYHTEMAYAYSAGVTTLCIVANTAGTIIATDKYTAPPAPAPVEGGDENA